MRDDLLHEGSVFPLVMCAGGGSEGVVLAPEVCPHDLLKDSEGKGIHQFMDGDLLDAALSDLVQQDKVNMLPLSFLVPQGP